MSRACCPALSWFGLCLQSSTEQQHARKEPQGTDKHPSIESLRQAGEKVATALGKGEGEQRPEWATGQNYPGSVAEGAAGGGPPGQERAAQASPAAETRVRCWVGRL